VLGMTISPCSQRPANCCIIIIIIAFIANFPRLRNYCITTSATLRENVPVLLHFPI